MLKDDRKMLNRFWILVDICTIIISYVVAYYIRFYFPFIMVGQGNFYPLGKYLELLIILIPMYLMIYIGCQVYTRKPERRKWPEYWKVASSNVIGIVCFLIVLYSLKEYNVSRIFMALFLTINIVLSVGTRMLYSRFYKDSHRNKL